MALGPCKSDCGEEGNEKRFVEEAEAEAIEE
jgi:hypothetical protein